MIPATSEHVCLTEVGGRDQDSEATFNNDQWKQQLCVTGMRVVQTFYMAQEFEKEVSKFNIH